MIRFYAKRKRPDGDLSDRFGGETLLGLQSEVLDNAGINNPGMQRQQHELRI